MNPAKFALKPVSELSEIDLLHNPVWSWLTVSTDQEIVDTELDLDETYLSTTGLQSIPNDGESCIVAATITLADGTELTGALEVFATARGLSAWSPVTMFFEGEYLGDFDPFPDTLEFLVKKLHRPAAAIYPMTWKSNVLLAHANQALGGSIASHQPRGAHPDATVLSAS